MEPTRVFSPFGLEGPKVVLFGKKTGNWNMSRLQSDWQSDSGLYFRLSHLADKFGFRQIFVPTPTDCNTIIANPCDFQINANQGACTLEVMRGAMSDGMILPKRSVGAIASADCPTIILYCPVMKYIIVGHGGSKSLVDVQHVFEGKPLRRHPSVVDAMMEKAKRYCFCSPQVFVTCGIQKYYWPALAQHLLMGEVGSRATSGNDVNLTVLIADQFALHGVDGVMTDTIDTFSDPEGEDDHLWHSYRRGNTPEEKAGRNLVLVVNR